MLLQSLCELCVYIDLCLSACFSGCVVRLDLITIDTFSGTEFFKVQHHAFLDRSEIVQAIQKFDLIVTGFHVTQVVISVNQMLRQIFKTLIGDIRGGFREALLTHLALDGRLEMYAEIQRDRVHVSLAILLVLAAHLGLLKLLFCGQFLLLLLMKSRSLLQDLVDSSQIIYVQKVKSTPE